MFSVSSLQTFRHKHIHRSKCRNQESKKGPSVWGKNLREELQGIGYMKGEMEKTEKAVTWNGGGQYRKRGERRDK